MDDNSMRYYYFSEWWTATDMIMCISKNGSYRDRRCKIMLFFGKKHIFSFASLYLRSEIWIIAPSLLFVKCVNNFFNSSANLMDEFCCLLINFSHCVIFLMKKKSLQFSIKKKYWKVYFPVNELVSIRLNYCWYFNPWVKKCWTMW